MSGGTPEPAAGATPGPRPPRLSERAELGIDGLRSVSLVGTGGSSTVYRARQDALDREVAVKVVHAAWTMETRERFEHERELMGRLSGHTDIVPIFETGITKRGEPFLVMPFYERGSLHQMLRDRGPLPWADAAYLIEGVAATVADCHREGIVHRDIKPGNVLLTRHLRPRLADFGIALPIDLATSPATVAYTPSYSPPEAYGPGMASATIDVFGLGATAWALLAGHPPPAVEGTEPVGGGPPPPHPDAPAAVVDLLTRSMAVDPVDRPPDAAAFLAEVRRANRRPGTGTGAGTGQGASGVGQWSSGNGRRGTGSGRGGPVADPAAGRPRTGSGLDAENRSPADPGPVAPDGSPSGLPGTSARRWAAADGAPDPGDGRSSSPPPGRSDRAGRSRPGRDRLVVLLFALVVLLGAGLIALGLTVLAG